MKAKRKISTEKYIRPPMNPLNNYSKEIVSKRINWLEKITKTKLKHIRHHSQSLEDMKGHIENPIGICQVPLGIVGPLKINGEHAKGNFYIPLATAEGTLLRTYDLGMLIVSRSGGVNVKILQDEMHISPIFILENLGDMMSFSDWVKNNFKQIKKEAEKTTRYGKLLRIETIPVSKRIILKFVYSTKDAMGANMVAIATEAACKYISKKTKKCYFIKSNYSSDKKISSGNFISPYGKCIYADAIIKESIIKKFNVSSLEMFEYYKCYVLGSSRSGAIGMNGHVINGLVALYIACGQDVAEVVETATSISNGEILDNGDIYISLYIPNILIGTVGGGTSLVTQKECLEMMGCYGPGKARKFAEIVAAMALAGEFSICASIAGGSFVDAFKKFGRKTSS